MLATTAPAPFCLSIQEKQFGECKVFACDSRATCSIQYHEKQWVEKTENSVKSNLRLRFTKIKNKKKSENFLVSFGTLHLPLYYSIH